MKFYLFLFFLIKFVFAINQDHKSSRLVHTCKNCYRRQTVNLPIRSVQNLELNQQFNDQLNNQQLNNQVNMPRTRRRYKRNSLSVQLTNNRPNKSDDKDLNDFLSKLNANLYEKNRSEASDEDMRPNRNLIPNDKNLIDGIHSPEHNAHHTHSNHENNEYQINSNNDEANNYLKNQKIKELQRKTFDQLQQIFEIELPQNPTLHYKLVELIQALLDELKHIKTRLWQANCKMRLSFKNQKIFSDCETNHEEPCNCPTEQLNDEKSNQKVNSDKVNTRDKKSNRSTSNSNVKQKSINLNNSSNKTNQLNSTTKLTNSTSVIKTNQNSSINSNKLTAFPQNQTDLKSSTNSSMIKSVSKSNSISLNKKTAPSTGPIDNIESKSKKETELSKQLRSAIDCFLCKHQWSNCLSFGIKCP